MRTIWKYTLKIEDYQEIAMPAGAEILDIQEQYNELCIWALVDTEAPIELRRFMIYGTGFSLIPGATAESHIATVQQSAGRLIWHIFGTP